MGEAAASSFGPAVLEDGLLGEVPSLSALPALMAVDGGLIAVVVAGVWESFGSGMLVLEISDLESMMGLSDIGCSGKDAPTIDTAVYSLSKACKISVFAGLCIL